MVRGTHAVLIISCLLGVESFPHEDSSLRVVGGDAVNITDVPFMARYWTKYNYRSCGAIIIHEKFLTTTANCYYNLHSLRWPSYVTVGSDQQKVPGDSYDIQTVYPHPNFMIKESMDYNIAILKLAKPLNFNERVKPIRLADKSIVVPEDAQFYTIGFGLVNIDMSFQSWKLPEQLQKAKVTSLSSEKCKELRVPVSKRMLCTLDEGKGLCLADQGAPLIYDNTLLGVSTFEYSCGVKDKPNVYTSIPVVREFIDKVLSTEA